MDSQNIHASIQKAFAEGKSKEDVYTYLLKEGFKVDEINNALSNLSPKAKITKKDNLSAPQILLVLGGIVTILGGVTYISINWHQWTPLERVLAILLPLIIAEVIGAVLWFKENYPKQALAFIITASLLFPLFSIVVFNEYKIYQGLPNAYGLSISLVSLIFFLIQSLIFSHPIWALLSCSAGLFVFHFAVFHLGINNYFKKYPVAWIYLIPSLLYIFLGFFYQKKGLIDRAKYIFGLGTIASIISLLYIFGFGYINDNNTWLLILASVGYFLVAAFFEVNKQKDNSTALYVISLITFLITLLKLAVLGGIIKTILPSLDQRSLVGFSSVIAGIIFLLLSYMLPKLTKFKLEEPSNFAPLFEVVGTLGILGSIFYLSLDGKKIIYETLLIIGSLGFIFTSISNQSRAFLYSGTLFLIVYIFDIGGEYFQNQIGWPITLFVAGLMSMAIGYGTEKLRKEYFKAE